MKKRMIIIVVGILAAGGAALALMAHEKATRSAATHVAVASANVNAILVAAPGRVEPVTEDIRLGSELNGKLKEVLVEEGDHVRKGQLLAVLVNDDYRADVESSTAQVASREADLRKTVNGARNEQRREAEASVKQAEAVLENACADMERHQKLYQKGVTAREDADHYEREYKVAKAQFDAAAQHFKFVDEETREEDVSRATADLGLTRAQLGGARARYEKTFVRAPIDGVVLRRYHRAGESVTNSANVPDPLFAIGNRETLRVRVDVDETDVVKVRVGDRAYVTADAFGTQKFWGHVVRIGGELGRKNIRTDEPSERVDTKILETLVELDDARELPVGLRVDAFIVSAER
jgi:ABC exporter DevB family membrane fusion protein